MAWITCTCGTVLSSTAGGCPVCGLTLFCQICHQGQPGACTHCDRACVTPETQCPPCRNIGHAWAHTWAILSRNPYPAGVDIRDYTRPVYPTADIYHERCPDCAGKVYPDGHNGMWCARAECAWQTIPIEEQAA